ncbi:MAG: response regulator [Acidobacteriota bacterium]|nr:MAG: response regulator [Acidobacteriota bacterium]
MPGRILLLEAQPDHAELIRDALEHAFPGVTVLRAEDASSASESAPEVILLALDTDPEPTIGLLERLTCRQPPPSIVVLQGAGDRWPIELLDQLPGAEVLDKRAGASFLAAIPQAVRRARRRRLRHLAAGHAGFAPAARPSSRPGVRSREVAAAWRQTPTQSLDRLARWLARHLTQRIEHKLHAVESTIALLASRADEALASTWRTQLRQATRGARQLAELTHVGRTGESTVLLPAGALISLRAPAWRYWLGRAQSMELEIDPRAPWLRVRLPLLGGLIDRCFEAMCSIAGVGGTVRVVLEPRASSAGVPGIRLQLTARGESPGRSPSACGRLLLLTQLAAEIHGGAAHWDGERRELTLDLRALAGHTPTTFDTQATGCRILVVDDDPHLCRVAERSLERCGFCVTTAEDGLEAVSLYEAGCRYELVLLDLNMPRMNGWQAFRRMRLLDPTLRAVLSSGTVDGAALRGLMGEGLVGFLPKPLGDRSLNAAVVSAVGSSKLESRPEEDG